MSTLRAFLNERAQVTFDVAGFAALYPGLASASWRMQIRPTQGSPTLYFDFAVSGEATYSATPIPSVEFQASTSAISAIPPGRWVYDFGFVLPGADFERAGGGFVVFLSGVTEAGVSGSPSPPSGSDDTWLPIGDSAPDFLSEAAAAAASANAAAASATTAVAAEAVVAADATQAATSASGAATSETAASGSATAAAGSATAAAASASAASTSATAAAASAAQLGPIPAEIATIQGGTLIGSQAPNLVLASPASGGAGPMTARALVAADLPGGGGGGGNVVTSIAALQALPTGTGATAYLDLGGQSGTFAWIAGDFTAQVLNDPGRGIYVPLAFTLSGTTSPNLNGTYTVAGTLNGKNYYQGSNGGFLYFKVVSTQGFWIISPTLGGSGIPDFAVTPTTAQIPPSGNYPPFNGATGTGVLSVGGATGAWVRAEYTAGGPIKQAWFAVLADGAKTTATGTMAFPVIPTAGQTITFTAHGPPAVVTTVASGATGLQVNIGGSPAAFVANLLTFLQSSANSQIGQCDWEGDAVATTIDVAYGYPGTSGNAFAISTNITGATVSATLSGGGTTGTDNAQALVNWSTFGKYLQTIQGGHVAVAPAGEVHYDSSFNSNQGATIFQNLGKWKWIGGPIDFVDIRTSAGQQAPNFVTTQFGGSYIADLIASTQPGDPGVTLLTPANVTRYPPKSGIRLESLDAQGFGGPSNPGCFEWHVVKRVDATTGFVTFEEQVLFAHAQDFPDSSTTLTGAVPCGAARIWPGQVGGVHWDTVEYEWDLDITLSTPPNQPIGLFIFNGNGGAWSVGGKSFRTTGLNTPISESLIRTSIHENYRSNPPFGGFGTLPDKQIGDSRFESPQIKGEVAYQNRAQNLQINGGYIQQLLTGTSTLRMVGTKLGSFGFGFICTGLAPSASAENIQVATNAGHTSNVPILFAGTTTRTIDGTNIQFGAASFTANNGGSHTYAGGVFTLLISTETPFAGFVIGTTFCFTVAAFGIFPGDQGVGRVTGMFQDATKYYIVTNRVDLTGVPSWAATPTPVTFFPVAQTKTIGSYGSDQVRLSSAAEEAGFRDFEYFPYDIYPLSPLGNIGQGVNAVGEIVDVGIDVSVASAGSVIAFNPNVADGNSSYTIYSGGLAIHINAAIAGRRVLSAAGLLGKQSGDTVTLGGVDITTTGIPPRAFIAGLATLLGQGSPFTASAKFWVQTRCGNVRTIVTASGVGGTGSVSNGGQP